MYLETLTTSTNGWKDSATANLTNLAMRQEELSEVLPSQADVHELY